MEAKFMVKINAGNDRCGNPRRGWIAYSDGGVVIEFFDEGHGGLGSVPPHLSKMANDAPLIMVTVSEYREMKKFSPGAIRVKDLANVLREVKREVEWKSQEDGLCDVRLRWYRGEWEVKFGISDYDTDHRGYWSSGYLARGSNCHEIAMGLVGELLNGVWAY